MKFEIFRFNKVKSTNNTAIRIIKNYNYDFGMILSDLQVNGRGQYGKKWVSYKGNLFVSFFYNLKNFKISLNNLTKKNIKIKCLFGVYGKERDDWISKSKLVLNMHMYDSKIFEIIRVFYLFHIFQKFLIFLTIASNLPWF